MGNKTRRAWFVCQEASGSVPMTVIQGALADAGFEVYTPPGDATEGPGIVWLEGTSSLIDGRLRELSREGRERVLVIASSGEILEGASAWRLLMAGASDVFAWNHFQDPAAEIRARFTRWTSVDELVDSPLVQGHMVGRCPAWRSALRQLVEAARFTDASILITGESGTGKDLAAHLIHALDPRPDKKDLVILDCASVVATLSGSEFFGHEKGAFTGAVAARDGAFALADGGTLFLDEVGELPPSLQAELLRVVQEGMYKRVGGNTWRRTAFRLVCATNKDLIQEESRGQFRKDFYHRIAACICRLPSLRERVEDIPELARHFLRDLRRDKGEVGVDRVVMDFLLKRVYPGNARDLRQLVARINSRHEGPGPITAGDIPPEERPIQDESPEDWRGASFELSMRRALAQGADLREITRAASETAIRIAVAAEGGNLQRASGRLGVTDRYLQMLRASRRNSIRTGS